MPLERTERGTYVAVYGCNLISGVAGWWRYSGHEAKRLLELPPDTPTLRNLYALLWAVVDIIDPSMSPSKWKAEEGLEAQARMSGGESGATRNELKQQFMDDICQHLRLAIGRVPGSQAIETTMKLIFGNDLRWDAEAAARRAITSPWPSEITAYLAQVSVDLSALPTREEQLQAIREAHDAIYNKRLKNKLNLSEEQLSELYNALCSGHTH